MIWSSNLSKFNLGSWWIYILIKLKKIFRSKFFFFFAVVVLVVCLNGLIMALKTQIILSTTNCEHDQRRCTMRDFGAGSICEHGRIRSRCRDCGGGSICEFVE